MDKVIANNNENFIEKDTCESEIVELSEGLLDDVRSSIKNKKAVKVPIAELATLGAGISSLVPAFNTVNQSITVSTSGLYKLANVATGDTLKKAKDGNFWGAYKTAKGGSRMVKLSEAGPLSASTQSVAAFNPATIMMAAALYSIEKDIKEIKKTQKEILSFLEVENESQIEADVETLTEIVTNYKYNWDNNLSVMSSHKLVMDIQNRARKNMIAYQKRIIEAISAKQFIVARNIVNSQLSDLEKNFKYYRLSLYTYTLASFIEIMLSSHFKEEYISKVRNEVKDMADTYRKNFSKSSIYLEKLSRAELEANLVRGIGDAGKVVGKFIGSIPLVKEGQVDEFLQDQGSNLRKKSKNMEQEAVKSFARMEDSGIGMIEEKMDDIIKIYNHTSQIYFDDANIYLLDE